MKLVVGFIVAAVMLLNIPDSKAQVTYTPTSSSGGVVAIPIPDSGGLIINVATGSAALPLQYINNNPASTLLQLGDDQMTTVPIGFTFPYWNQNFTTSYMSSNGFINFTGNIPGAGCCSGQDLAEMARQRNTTYNYMIAGVWTDLLDTTGRTTYTLGTGASRTYGWYGTKEYGTNNSNTFEININSSGQYDVRYGSAFVSQGRAVTAGATGNLANGEYFQYYHGSGLNISAANPVSWGNSTINACAVSPISDPSCPGYAAVFTVQQCTISALFDPSCPGYQQAYFDQQCTSSSLYNSSCPGYQSAYTTQQCSINPLYSTTCPGYQQAYQEQQCSLNSLYSTTCPGYARAYFDQQCSISALFSPNCPGYAQAYHNQQCTANPLFMSDCPGYAAAYLSQQCSLNGLYDRTCPNYSTAYATKMLLEQQGMASTVATAGVVAQNAPKVATVSNDGTVSATPSKTGDATIDKAIEQPSQTSTLSVAPAGRESAAAPPPPPAAGPMAQAQQERKQEGGDRKPEGKQDGPQGGDRKPEGKQDGPQGGPGGPQQAEQKPEGSKPQTKREEIAQQRQEAAKEKAVEAGKNLAKTMGDVKSMEDVTKNQALVIGAMGYVAGFNAYNVQLQDNSQFYKPYQVYGNQRNIDNSRVLRGLTNDGKHNSMVELQYTKGN